MATGRQVSLGGLGAAVALFSGVGVAACGGASHATSNDGGATSDGATQEDSATRAKDGASVGHRDGATPRHDAGSSTGREGGSVPDAGHVVATASSWLGTNVDVDLPFADITYLMNGFGTPAAQLDVNGYPVAGVSGTSSTDMGFELPTGTYDISYVGSGTLAVSGIGALVSPTWTTFGDEHRNQVKITATPGSFGNFLTLTVTNAGSQSVTSIHLTLPGLGYDPKSPFNPQFLRTLAPFRAMRFMGYLATNNSTLADWASVPLASQFGSSKNGHPYDLMAELINETGKDGWINVPEHATSDFIAKYAALMAAKLDFPRIAAARQAAGITAPFQLIVESSNETWNSGFTAYATFLAAAGADPSRYTGTYTGTTGPTWMSGNSDLMKVAQYHADRLATIAQAFRTAFGTHADAIAPVLSGWALGAAYSDEGLSFLAAQGGTPKDDVTYVALAPYFSTADDSTTGSLATLFPALETGVTASGAAFPDFVTLRQTYGISIAAYEGGQSLSGTTNEPVKHLAQFDARMNAAYTAYLALWEQSFGPSLFMHFSLAGTPGLPENIYQYGFWGSLTGVSQDTATCGKGLPMLTGTESLASVSGYCPKYAALAAHVPD